MWIEHSTITKQSRERVMKMNMRIEKEYINLVV